MSIIEEISFKYHSIIVANIFRFMIVSDRSARQPTDTATNVSLEIDFLTLFSSNMYILTYADLLTISLHCSK